MLFGYLSLCRRLSRHRLFCAMACVGKPIAGKYTCSRGASVVFRLTMLQHSWHDGVRRPISVSKWLAKRQSVVGAAFREQRVTCILLPSGMCCKVPSLTTRHVDTRAVDKANATIACVQDVVI